MIKIGYINGSPKRINEKSVDQQWISFLGEYSELVPITPFSLFKIFKLPIEKWVEEFPESLNWLQKRLIELKDNYKLDAIYLNMPLLIPYILLARNVSNLKLSILFIAHSIGSQSWLKQWLSIAPFITSQDLLISSTASCCKALDNLSDVYKDVFKIPLCIRLSDNVESRKDFKNKNLKILSIGRIEDVKNIDVLIKIFNKLQKKYSNLKLIIAGEYTGDNDNQIELYKSKISSLISKYSLESNIHFCGAVYGNEKEQYFNECDFIINLSTDPGETFGYNLLEAKARGIPVICTYWDGFKEIVKENEDGIFLDCKWDNDEPEINIEHAVQKIISAIENKEAYKKMSSNALKNINQFNYKKIIPQIISKLENKVKNSILNDKNQINYSDLALSRIKDMENIYQHNNINELDYFNFNPLNIMLHNEKRCLKDWMPKVKKIIKHFS